MTVIDEQQTSRDFYEPHALWIKEVYDVRRWHLSDITGQADDVRSWG
jgi:hypothetical protein